MDAFLRAGGTFPRFVWNAVAPYAIAIVLVTIAFAPTYLLRGVFPYPFLFLFFAAVMASAWFGGTAAGLFAVFLSTIVVEYFFVPPFNSFAINATDGTYFAAFVACALIASWVSASKKKSEQELREARDYLGVRVAERTAELQQTNRELRRSMEEHRTAQQALMQTQAELAHLSRVLTMGELTSSIAHEINQPLTAVVTHGQACLEWLSPEHTDLAKARQTAKRIIEDGTRAGAVLGRIRALFTKQQRPRDWVDLNEAIVELTVFLRDEALRQGITVRTDLLAGLPRIFGDRIQLQQVVLNLMMNAMDAMRGAEGSRELLVSSRADDSGQVSIRVEDGGAGLSPEIQEKIFQPFFTTKPQGIGMGLSISRSIVESHEGRIWVARRPSGGTIFQFAIPVHPKNSDG